MTLNLDHDVRIKVNFTTRDGTQDFITLEEFDSREAFMELAQISRRVIMHDTADVIFRMFAKVANKEAKLSEISKKLPCLKGKYTDIFSNIFNRPEIAAEVTRYNSTTDKNVKREIRNNISKILIPEVEQNVAYDDLYFNFTKFRFGSPSENKSLKQKFKEAKITAEALLWGLKTKDKFSIAIIQLFKENISKRTEESRKSYWLLVRDSKGKLIGMTFISAAKLKDKLTGKNIIGHSGQILDPSVQGRGYVSVIKSAMIDFLYDNMDEATAKECLFATTCNELNENSQGLQYKSGAKPLTDKYGRLVVDANKIHWYATKDDIMNSEIMKQCIERNVSYEVSPILLSGKQLAYRKFVGRKKREILNNEQIKETSYDR